jgi:hypothetical protein
MYTSKIVMRRLRNIGSNLLQCNPVNKAKDGEFDPINRICIFCRDGFTGLGARERGGANFLIKPIFSVCIKGNSKTH